MKLSPKQVEKIIDDNEKAAAIAQLVYYEDEQLTIERKRRGRGFSYYHNTKNVKDKSSLARIKKLVIPPAWKNVRISDNPNSHLQATGIDSKGRKQYLYHPRWNQIKNSTKFFRMSAFGEALAKIRDQVVRDLRRRKMDKQKCIALVIRLMEETHIRIGNNQYARANKTYGLSTMRKRHLTEEDGTLYFEFTGKKGKQHKVPIEDKKLSKLVMQCEEIPGWELFKYTDEDGHHRIDSGMVNDYLHEITKNSFTAKDFRTWAASKIFLETILEIEPPQNETALNKIIQESCNIAAAALGNTRTVCRKYYIHPAVIEAYEKNTLPSIKNLSKSKLPESLEDSEKLLLNIIENYTFKIDEE